jgi:transcriptional antiterminator NusG
MAKQWFVLHTYSGHENKVKSNIEKKMAQEGLKDWVVQVAIPSESVAEVKDGKRVVTTRKVFPGYVMIEMDIPEGPKTPDEHLKIQEVYQKIRDIPGVTGFLGTATQPVPLRQEEVDNILAQGQEGAQKKPKAKMSFSVGEKVKVIEGPFANFYGTVTEYSDTKGKLTVEISIFGRPTPLELDVFQVERE